MSRNLRLQVVMGAVDKVTAPLRKISESAKGVSDELRQTRDQLRHLDSQQKSIKSFQDLSRQARQTQQALGEKQTKVRELARELANTENPTKRLNNEFRKAQREAATLKQRHSSQRQELQTLRGQLQSTGVSTSQLGDHSRRLRQDQERLNQTLDQQKKRLEAIGRQEELVARRRAAGEKLHRQGMSVAAHGAGAMYGGQRALRGIARFAAPGVDFDTTMSRVQALTRLEKDSPELEMMRQQARELGARTLFTSTEVAEGQAFLAQAGFTPQRIKASMVGILDLAKAGEMAIGETADISSNILTGMNLDADQMGRVADVLTGALTRSNTTLASLGETMKYAAPGAARFGVEIETVAAMAAKLGDSALQGSMGGTGIRRVISRLTAPNKAAQDALNKLGVEIDDGYGRMRDLPEILSDIYNAAKDFDELEAGTLWKDIAGETGAGVLGILVDQAGTGQLQELIAELQKNQGEAAQVAAVMADNWAGEWDQFKSATADIGIELFENQDSALREYTRSLTSVMRSVGEWIRENPKLAGSIAKWVAVGLAAITVLGALAMMIGAVMMALGILKKAGVGTLLVSIGKGLLFLGKAMLANPIIAAIALLGFAAYMVWKRWDGIKGGLLAIWDTLGGSFGAMLSNMGKAAVNWSPFGLFYKAFAKVLSWFGIDLPNNLIDGLIGGLTAGWGALGGSLNAALATIGKAIVNWSPFGLFYKAFAKVLSWFGIDLPNNLIDGLIGGITAGWGKVVDGIKGLAEKLPGPIKSVLGIHSPSRVFAALGDDTMDGLALGLQRSEDGPLAAVTKTARRLAATGALAMGFGMTPALAVDTRPPLATAQPSGVVIHGGIQISVQASPGMDEQALARRVAAEVQRALAAAQHQTAVRERSAFRDTD